MTREELAAENARLRAEAAELRDLLAAVRDLADVPQPAVTGDAQGDDRAHQRYLYACDRRIGHIAVYAAPAGEDGGPVPAGHLHWRAQQLRAEAARPLGYAPADGDTAPGAAAETVPAGTGPDDRPAS